MIYKDLYLILVEAEHRISNFEDSGVRERSQETVNLVNERLCKEGLTREQLKKLAALT